ncbi:MAG: DUF2087 domain-containing protein [Gaiellaceae bacterium]
MSTHRVWQASLIAEASSTRTATTSAKLIGLLADEERLRVFAAIALGARTVDAAAEAAGVDVATVQGALPRLVSAGLVEQRDGLHVSLAALQAAARERPPRVRELPDATVEQQRVLRNFVAGGRLARLPVRQGQRRVILEYVAGRFETDRQYAEPEVNELLKSLHDDHVTLRRYLVDEGLLDRKAGVYRRVRPTA